MSPEEIENALKLCDQATAAPWSHSPYSVKDANENYLANVNDSEYVENPNAINDAAFIAAAREGWPKALNEITRLKKQMECMEVKHQFDMVPEEIIGDFPRGKCRKCGVPI